MKINRNDRIAGDLVIIAGPCAVESEKQIVETAIRIKEAGADYLGVGAMFPTSTKQDAEKVSVETLKQICEAVSIPVVAIGGITEQNVSLLSGSGIAGVAVISAIFAQSDIKEATRKLTKLAEQMVEA